MAIQLTIVLSGPGGVLDRTEITGLPGRLIHAEMQSAIHAAIAAWTLAPGDTIEILGNEEAFDKL